MATTITVQNRAVSKHKPGIEQLIVEVNGHLPEGLKLVAPITKKAMRYARSCLAYTYKDDATATGEGARVLGPLNAALDRIGQENTVVADHEDIFPLGRLETQVHEIAPAAPLDGLAAELAAVVQNDRDDILLLQ